MSYYRLTGLAHKTGIELAQALATIPATTTSLDLSGNGLGNKTDAELAQILTAIPATVTSLILRNNVLCNKTGVKLVQTFAAIPVNVTSLDLSNNVLNNEIDTELAQAFAAIPTSVTSLDLSDNFLHDKSGTELAQIFAAIPASVTSLHLRGNALYYDSDAELAQAFAAIPATVTSLDLDANYLGNKTGAELARVFKAIPIGVTSLDLSDNDLGSKSSAELAIIFAVIPPHVKIINLGNNKLFTNESRLEPDEIIVALGQNRSRFVLTKNGESQLDRTFAPMSLLLNRSNGLFLDNDTSDFILRLIADTSELSISGSFYPEALQECRNIIQNGRKKLLIQIKETTTAAIDSYLSDSNHSNKQQSSNKFFASTVGPIDRMLIESFRVKLNIQQSYNTLVDVIDEFLPNPQHPVALALLDSLSELKGSAWAEKSIELSSN